jgi:hypothetical protein
METSRVQEADETTRVKETERKDGGVELIVKGIEAKLAAMEREVNAELAATESQVKALLETTRVDEAYKELLETTRVDEAYRMDEDNSVDLLVKEIEAELAATESAFGGLFNPPRNGDCLMRCAVEHDELATQSAKVDKVHETERCANELKVHETERCANELRLLVVARVAETALESLEKRAQDADVRAAQEMSAAASEASTHASSTSSGGGVGPASEHLRAAAQHFELAAWLRSEEARGEVNARCAAMARQGTVMGEDELQALADVRGACVQWTEHYINTKRIEYACRLVKRQSVRSR